MKETIIVTAEKKDKNKFACTVLFYVKRIKIKCSILHLDIRISLN